MRLQLALDDISLADALGLVEQVRDCLDIVEIGTPLIIEEGLAPVRALKARFPGLEVLADTRSWMPASSSRARRSRPGPTTSPSSA